MTEALKAKDWLVDLQAAAEVDDSNGFQDLIVAIAKVRPDLEPAVCRVAGEYLEDGETWAAGFFKKPLEEQRVNEPEPQPSSDEGWGRRRSWGGEEEEERQEWPSAAKADAAEEEAKEAEPEPEIDGPEREAPEAMFRRERAKPDDDVPILSKAAPFDSAREFARRHCFQQGADACDED